MFQKKDNVRIMARLQWLENCSRMRGEECSTNKQKPGDISTEGGQSQAVTTERSMQKGEIKMSD